jgi:hypothetical protein
MMFYWQRFESRSSYYSYIKDITNKTNQYISDNNGSIFIIREYILKVLY